MASYLLDTSVIVDALNGRMGRRELLFQLATRSSVLSCCTINVIEVYSGMRAGEERETGNFLDNLVYYDVTRNIAIRSGALRFEWARKGRSLSLADVTIAAVALEHDLTLMTDNEKHYPMPDLAIYSFSS